jgi:cardiolipin synthase
MGNSQSDRWRDQVWNAPNLLSVLRLFLVPIFFWLLLEQHFIWGVAVLAFAGATDFFDGLIARRFNLVTRLGQLLDPAADRLYIFSTLLALSINGIIPVWIAALVISRDVVLAIAYVVLANFGYGPLPVHILGKAATFSLLYAFPLLVLARVLHSAANYILPLAWAFALWGVALYWWAGAVYLIQVFGLVRTHKSARLNR